MKINNNVKSKILRGIVISNKMNKTLVVSILKLVKDKVYGKYIKRKSKIHVHDENNICNENDYIEIKSCRPYSKTKSWFFYRFIRKINN